MLYLHKTLWKCSVSYVGMSRISHMTLCQRSRSHLEVKGQIMAWKSHKMPIFDVWPLNMTLTFDMRSRILYMTHLHMTLDIFTEFYYDATITRQVMARTSFKMPIFDLWPLSVTLTFDMLPWFLYVTRLHMTLDIFTKFYEDTTITYQVMARTSFKMPIFLHFDL